MKIEGSIDSIIFRNEENGYSVIVVKTKKDYLTLVGEMYNVEMGLHIRAEVVEVESVNYGLQYKVLNYDCDLPNDNDAIVKLLSSNDFRGVGEVLAKRLVDTYEEDIFDIIENHTEELFNVKGITKKRIDTLVEGVSNIKSELDSFLYLKKYNIGIKQIKKIISIYGSKTKEVIEKNPYQLAYDVSGIGFLLCDEIAVKNGIDKDSEFRKKAAIYYVVNESYYSGDTFIYIDELYDRVHEILNVEFDIEKIIYDMQFEAKIVIVNSKRMKIFLDKSYEVESNLSRLLYNLRDNIEIITGGPGTGKTYNVKKIISENSDKGFNIILCAPTGRAAKRMSEVTNFEAKTIHRLLEYGLVGGDSEYKKFGFVRNEKNKLDCDLLIVDEMSMTDEWLFYNLMKAVKDTTRVILVGDVDQLPSVGAGNVLKDIIDSKLFKVEKLTKIHRQENGSNIVINAHKVNNGENVDLKKESEDFKFIHMEDENRIKNAICKLVSLNIPKFFNISQDKIQVITPTQKGKCGVLELNEILQNAINPPNKNREIKIGSKIFRLQDKVMQIKNNYELYYQVVDENENPYSDGYGVFNGDIGFVFDINYDKQTIMVRYDDRQVEYDIENIDNLTLAYAITVHKSQGSEYDVVVMPMAMAPRQLLNRKILYTAMTRAKKCICFIGREDIFKIMINDKYEDKRNSALCDEFYIS